MREYAFELALCARLERDREAVIARQVGGGVRRPGGRVLDTVLVEPGPEFDRRAAVTDRSIPLPATRVGPGRARRPTDAFDLPPERARRVAERGIDAGFLEPEYCGGSLHVRAATRYPDWIGSIVAVENKPDLGTPGDLRDQLRTDASLALADRVVVATASHVTGAHLARIPDPVGVWRFQPGEGVGDPDSTDDPPEIEVVRKPARLPVEDPGIELLERHPGRDEIAVVAPDEKRRARRRIGERVYGKGWRPAEFPACARVREGTFAGGGGLPYCTHFGRIVDPGSDCGPDCPGREDGEAPEVDPAAERDRRTPWVRDPGGIARRQSGLDRFS